MNTITSQTEEKSFREDVYKRQLSSTAETMQASSYWSSSQCFQPIFCYKTKTSEHLTTFSCFAMAERQQDRGFVRRR